MQNKFFPPFIIFTPGKDAIRGLLWDFDAEGKSVPDSHCFHLALKNLTIVNNVNHVWQLRKMWRLFSEIHLAFSHYWIVHQKCHHSFLTFHLLGSAVQDPYSRRGGFGGWCDTDHVWVPDDCYYWLHNLECLFYFVLLKLLNVMLIMSGSWPEDGDDEYKLGIFLVFYRNFNYSLKWQEGINLIGN